MIPAGVQHGMRHPGLGQMDPPLATRTAEAALRELQLTSTF